MRGSGCNGSRFVDIRAGRVFEHEACFSSYLVHVLVTDFENRIKRASQDNAFRGIIDDEGTQAEVTRASEDPLTRLTQHISPHFVDYLTTGLVRRSVQKSRSIRFAIEHPCDCEVEL